MPASQTTWLNSESASAIGRLANAESWQRLTVRRKPDWPAFKLLSVPREWALI